MIFNSPVGTLKTSPSFVLTVTSQVIILYDVAIQSRLDFTYLTSLHLGGYFLLSSLYISSSYIKEHFNLPHLPFNLSMSLHSKCCSIRFSISILGRGSVVLQCIGIIPSAPQGNISVLGSIFTISLAHT